MRNSYERYNFKGNITHDKGPTKLYVYLYNFLYQ